MNHRKPPSGMQILSAVGRLLYRRAVYEPVEPPIARRRLEHVASCYHGPRPRLLALYVESLTVVLAGPQHAVMDTLYADACRRVGANVVTCTRMQPCTEHLDAASAI